MRIEEFNALSEADAAVALRGCVAIDSWVGALIDGRPYASTPDLLASARAQAACWTPTEVRDALADHPRIGERPTGAEAGAAHSRHEQAGLGLDDTDLAARLGAGNVAYEQRFGRIYLVRARHRTGPELLAILEQRLGNDPETELEVTHAELGEIALLRLTDLLEEEVRR